METPLDIHLIGVSGTGMGSLAGLLASLGHRITGSDVAFHPPMGPLLQQWGVECQLGFEPQFGARIPDLVVVGNVCRASNPQARHALDRGWAVTHMPAALDRFALNGRRSVVVAGTHGKTTTASLCTWVLEQSGLRPGFFIGGVPLNFGQGFRTAELGAPFVVEGDEYDTAFFEKTPKFLHYHPHHAIVTSLEHDHVDIYPTPELYFEAFRRFVELVPPRGVLVANRDDPAVFAVVTRHARCRVEWYGYRPGPGWSLTRQPLPGGRQHVELGAENRTSCSFDLELTGEHNAANATAALLLAHCAFGCELDVAAKALLGFRGAKRRLERLGTFGDVCVYDDFAHHPTAVRLTLEGLRSLHPSSKIVAAFEPRSATACRPLHQQAYAESFGAADAVVLAPVGRAELPEGQRLNTERLAEELRRQGTPAWAASTMKEVLDRLIRAAQPGDGIVLLSNGAFGGIQPELFQRLAEGRPQSENEVPL